MFNIFKKSEKATDPICLMRIDKKTAKFSYPYEDETYYFCSDNCYQDFKKDPKRYID